MRHLIFYFFILYFTLFTQPIFSEDSTYTQATIDSPQKASSPHKVTGAVAFLSDYRSRGISQTMRNPAVQGEFKYTYVPAGFYIKAWASNVDGSGNFLHNTSLEFDVYLGFNNTISALKEVSYDVGLIYYWYPGGQAFVPQTVKYNTLEIFASLKIKGFQLKVSDTLTDFFGVNSYNPPFNWDKKRFASRNGNSIGSPYIEANWEIQLISPWIFTLHTGYQCVVHYPELNYLDWQIAVTYPLSFFDVSAYYVSTTAKSAFYTIGNSLYKPKRIALGGTGFVVGITKTF